MNQTDDALAAHPLTERLPQEVTGTGHGWFTDYRRHPVFSPAWVRGRWRILAPILLCVLLLLVGTALLDPVLQNRPWPGMADLLLSLLLPAALGPALALWVRRRGWPATREWWALVAVMLGVVVAMSAYRALAAEPLKQQIAELTGQIGPDGKRKRVRMVVGVTVSSPDDPADDKLRRASVDDPLSVAWNETVHAAVTVLMAGGLGLVGWRRQRSALVRLAHDKALARAEAQRREAELRLSVLAAQVEPHFLFNTLAGVRSAISTDPGRASDMIDRLVDYLRAAIPRLRGDGGAQATLGSQLDIVRAYLGLMAARMPRLRFDIAVPAGLLNARCPPLMLISLAENAVKHGAEPKIGPVCISLTARCTDDGRLAVTVADDGAGFDAQRSASGDGLGLSNIRERLRQMHGEGAALDLRAQPGGGVAATMTLPLELT